MRNIGGLLMSNFSLERNFVMNSLSHERRYAEPSHLSIREEYINYRQMSSIAQRTERQAYGGCGNRTQVLRIMNPEYTRPN